MNKALIIMVSIFFIFLLNIGVYGKEKSTYIFLQPVNDDKGQTFLEKDGKKYPLLEESPSDKVKAIEELLKDGMPALSLRLDRMEKNFILNQIQKNGLKDEETSNIFAEPLYICIIKGGNRPKCGFFLKKGDEIIEKTKVFYIEMPPDSYQFEKIFSHEHGHLLDFYILNYSFPSSPVRPVHTISAVTNFETAFLEGWGEHFEIMTVDMTKNQEFRDFYNLNDLKGKSYFFYLQDMLTIGQSFKRYLWVKGNLFAFKKNNCLTDGLTGEEFNKNFMYNWMNYSFSGGELKNAHQMLCCEGVCSNMFYRMATDKNMMGRYREADFYRYFSDKENDITPQENIYLKMIYAKYRLFKDYEKEKPFEAGPLFLDFVKKYMELFPEDRDDILQIFCLSTFFTTSFKNAGEIYRKADFDTHMLCYDMEGTSRNFKELYGVIQSNFNEIKKDSSLLYKNVGPPLWIDNETFKPVCLGQKMDCISINLNGAEDFELMTLEGMTVKQAEELIECREKAGYFSSIKDIEDTGILTEKQVRELLKMRELYMKRCKNQ